MPSRAFNRILDAPALAWLGTLVWLAAVAGATGLEGDLPWRQTGLTERQAAAHLLDRFAYGARPGDIDEMVALGLGNWIEGQLAGDLPGSVLAAKLTRAPVVAMTQKEIVRRYTYGKGRLVREALDAGVFSVQDYSGENGERKLEAAVAALQRLAAERGMQPQNDLLDQLKAQKVWRAVYSDSQLVEVLTDFWLNHFNVSITHLDARAHVLSYERDAIRPHVLGSFRRLLGATARHPAMLRYLGNAQSVADPGVTTAFDLEVQDLDRLSPGANPSYRMLLAKQLGWFRRHRKPGRERGLNENYARELLELHTLGVDGGYRQRDVIEVARAFTGWTTFPPGGARKYVEQALVQAETAETARDMGFVIEDEFVFRADRHDAEPKTVLDVPLPAGRGIEDGEEVLDLVAAHPATRRRLARKLAVRFVSERPPEALVRRLEETWELTGGDLVEVTRTLVRSAEFWSEAARRGKIKTPFELAVSALRALDADVVEPKELIRWLARMGQPLYGYSAPTGYPDRGHHWANVGPLLGRVNFGVTLASSRIPGVRIDLMKPLGRQHRLESLEQAAELYFPLLLPERDPTLMLELISEEEPDAGDEPKTAAKPAAKRPEHLARQTEMRARAVVGMLIGSPEFQVK